MTRETKIGLLVGLGFIVVFAVLLSHNGSGPSPTQQLSPIAQNSTDASRPARTPLTQSPVGTADAGSPALSPVLPPAPTGPELVDPIDGLAVDTGDALPTPTAFDRTDVIARGASRFEAAPAEAQSMAMGDRQALEEAVAMARPPMMSLESSRVVPPVVTPPEPEPEARAIQPQVSPAPDAASGQDQATPSDRSGGEREAVVAAPPKPYVVQKGDTLVKITREIYNNSSPKVIDFVVSANKGNIKDRNSLREGQTIVTPPLPPDMFEEQTMSVGRNSANMRTVQHLLDEIPVPRRAPEGHSENSAERTGAVAEHVGRPSLPLGEHPGFIPVTIDKSSETKTGKDDAPAKSGQAAPGIRLYEVQPKDTFSSIAQRELGSSHRWVEIKQMNKDINPVKIRPGMKIRLPARDAASEDSEDRASA